MPQRDASIAEVGRTKNVHLGVDRFQKIRTKKKSRSHINVGGTSFLFANEGSGGEKILEPVMLLLL